ncbi:MAG: molecular chaperone DnaK, partial [Bacteroidota bacterium]
ELKEAHKSEDLDRIDRASANLNTAWQAASQEMYQATQGQGAPFDFATGGAQQDGGGAGETQGGNGADNVTDVEYEEVKNK